MGRSDELLSFDCGGQQWVLENAFPVGTLRCKQSSACRIRPNLADHCWNIVAAAHEGHLWMQAGIASPCDGMHIRKCRNPSGADISYMEELLAEIEQAGASALQCWISGIAVLLQDSTCASAAHAIESPFTFDIGLTC